MSTHNICFYEDFTKIIFKYHQICTLSLLLAKRINCVYFKMSRVVRKPAFAYAKTKTQISFAVPAKLISAFVFATLIVQSLYFLNTKFQASSYLLWLCSLVCVGSGNPEDRFSHNEAQIILF